LEQVIHYAFGPGTNRQEGAAGMGRPREFDEDEVLTAAADVFWAKGYGATSTRDLSECTGLTPASIYNAYNDKRSFFLRALEQYLERNLRERITRLEACPSPGDAIVGFFKEIVDRSLEDPEHRGCMLVNSAIEATSQDYELQLFVAGQTSFIERFFLGRIIEGQRVGEFSTDQPADDLARMLLSVAMGLRVLARVRPDPKLLNGLVGPALAILNLSWPAGKKAARKNIDAHRSQRSRK
jgi:TetR/AcrR family transcriptional repressor of nem operon